MASDQEWQLSVAAAFYRPDGQRGVRACLPDVAGLAGSGLLKMADPLTEPGPAKAMTADNSQKKYPFQRLTNRRDFLRLRARGNKQVMDGFILQADLNPDNVRVCRTGYTASKKIGNAVQRNRARRRLRALVRELMCDSGRPGTDYVVIARASVLRADFARLRADFQMALVRLHKKLDRQQNMTDSTGAGQC